MGKFVLAGLVVLMAFAAVLMGDLLAAEVPLDTVLLLR